MKNFMFKCQVECIEINKDFYQRIDPKEYQRNLEQIIGEGLPPDYFTDYMDLPPDLVFNFHEFEIFAVSGNYTDRLTGMSLGYYKTKEDCEAYLQKSGIDEYRNSIKGVIEDLGISPAYQYKVKEIKL